MCHMILLYICIIPFYSLVVCVWGVAYYTSHAAGQEPKTFSFQLQRNTKSDHAISLPLPNDKTRNPHSSYNLPTRQHR